MQFIKEYIIEENTKVKKYGVIKEHPMFVSLRNLILQYIGIDQLMEHILNNLGDVFQVYLTGDLAQGKNSHYIDLNLLGEVDRTYMFQLIEKVEQLIKKKVRIALFGMHVFKKEHFEGVAVVLKMYGRKHLII